MSTPFPLPAIDAESAPFWEGCRRHVFLLQRCSGCQAYRYPPAPICPTCLSEEWSWQQSSGKGTVYSYTITYQAVHPALMGKLPLAPVVVQLEEGMLVTSNLTDVPPEEIAIGMPVEVCFEDVTKEITLPKFQRAGTGTRR